MSVLTPSRCPPTLDLPRERRRRSSVAPVLGQAVDGVADDGPGDLARVALAREQPARRRVWTSGASPRMERSFLATSCSARTARHRHRPARAPRRRAPGRCPACAARGRARAGPGPCPTASSGRASGRTPRRRRGRPRSSGRAPGRDVVVAAALAQLPLELGPAARRHAQLAQDDRPGDGLGVGLRRTASRGPPAEAPSRAARPHRPSPPDRGCPADPGRRPLPSATSRRRSRARDGPGRTSARTRNASASARAAAARARRSCGLGSERPTIRSRQARPRPRRAGRRAARRRASP